MGTDFTGTDAWVATLTGPANADDLTAESCTDMGVQLANRTTWLAARIDDTFQWEPLYNKIKLDVGSAYSDIDTEVGNVWAPLANYYDASVNVGAKEGILRLEWTGTIENTNASDFGEIRLQVDGTDFSAHARVELSSIASVHLVLYSAGVYKDTVNNIGLYGRLEVADGGAIKTIGSGELQAYKLIITEVP